MKADLNIAIVTPAPPGSKKGNRITANRWAGMLRDLGHRVRILHDNRQDFRGKSFDTLIALHARKSYPAIKRYACQQPNGNLIVILTGTDLYRDIKTSQQAKRSLKLATKLVVLHPRGVASLPKQYRSKSSVIIQSVLPLKTKPAALRNTFEVCVLGHLRPVKDPFRAAQASRRLPTDSKIRITHLGAALTPAMARQAEHEMQRNPRYHWLGEKQRHQARRILARSKLMVISSKMEGAANVLSEAIVDGTPVLASKIDGNIGILGETYPGYFPVGDTNALALLLLRAEQDRAFYDTLKQQCRIIVPALKPAIERSHLAILIKWK